MKAQGFGEDNEEQEEGLRCIAVPVFDRFGVVIAGMSISFRPSVSQKSASTSMSRCCIAPGARSPRSWATTTILSNP